MNKVDKNKLVPELRFPEFINGKDWSAEPMTKLYSFKSTYAFSRDKLTYEEGEVRNIHYGDIHTKFASLFDISKEVVPFIRPGIPLDKIKADSYCIEGDLIFADASEDLEGVGKSIEIINLNDEKLISGLHTLLARPKKRKLIIGFGGHLFLSDSIRIQIQKEAQGAKVLGISANRIGNIIIYYPENKKEQQKIADCFSSIDELIAAQSQKLEALHAHKKGLLQNLFPAEGETVPELRYPEFEDDGDWIEKTLGQVVHYENGKAHEQDIEEQGDYIVVNSKFISTDGEVKKYTNTANLLAKEGDILMVLSDVPNGRAIAKCFYVDKNDTYTVNQRICKLTSKKAVSLVLCYLINRNPYFLAFDDGVKQTNLRKDDVLNCPLLLPKDPKEQQKIADCLSSIDELIKAQIKKLEALKAHKKGLMQQLFPNPNQIANE